MLASLPKLELIHLPLVGYFVLIAGLLAFILPPFVKRQPRTSSIFFIFMALQSLVTWKYMLRYFDWSWTAAAARAGKPDLSSAEWLLSTSLFEEAWLQVCKATDIWWISEQLCAWTAGPLLIFIVVEGKRRGLKHCWAYMVLGQVVAISVAQSLFLAALCLAPRAPLAAKPNKKASKEPECASWTLLASVLISLLTIGLTPKFLDGPYFLPNLLLMHAVLLVPFLPYDPLPKSSLTYSQLYTFAALIALRLRLPSYQLLWDAWRDASRAALTLPADEGFSLATLRQWLPDLFRGELAALYAHPANSSIGFDVIFTTISFLAYIFYDNHKSIIKTPVPLLLGLVTMTPLVGIAVSGGLWLGTREADMDELEVKLANEAERTKVE